MRRKGGEGGGFVENKIVALELKDETSKISGGILAIGRGVCHFTPRWIPNPGALFFPYRDKVRVSAVLKLIRLITA